MCSGNFLAWIICFATLTPNITLPEFDENIDTKHDGLWNMYLLSNMASFTVYVLNLGGVT